MKSISFLFCTKRILVGALILFISTLISFSVSQADIIEVISQTYHIEGGGYIGVQYPFITNIDTTFPVSIDASGRKITFNGTSDHPLSNDLSVYGESVPSGQPGMFYSFANTNSEITSEYAYVSVSSYFYDMSNATAISPEAIASITFAPLVSSMLVERSGETAGTTTASPIGITFSLIDVTDNIIIPLPMNGGVYISPILLSFDLSHVYSITAMAYGGAWSSVGGTLSISSVPEPTTMLLLGSGLIGLLGFRRKLRK